MHAAGATCAGCSHRGEVHVSAETYFALEGTTVACPAAFDVLTHPRIDLIEGSGYLVGSQEFTHWGHRLVKEDRPGQQP